MASVWGRRLFPVPSFTSRFLFNHVPRTPLSKIFSRRSFSAAAEVNHVPIMDEDEIIKRDKRLEELRKKENFEAVLKLKPVELVFIADFEPSERAHFANMEIPFIFEQCMLDFKLTKNQRRKVLTLYETLGAAKCADYLISNVKEFAFNHIGLNPDSKASVPTIDELKTEYRNALVRYNERTQRHLDRVTQPELSGREWLLEMAEYVENMKVNMSEVPSWARFVMSRRALRDFYYYCTHGNWKLISRNETTGTSLNAIVEILSIARVHLGEAHRLAFEFQKTEPELHRRLLEPALGAPSLLEARYITKEEMPQPVIDIPKEKLELYNKMLKQYHKELKEERLRFALDDLMFGNSGEIQEMEREEFIAAVNMGYETKKFVTSTNSTDPAFTEHAEVKILSGPLDLIKKYADRFSAGFSNFTVNGISSSFPIRNNFPTDPSVIPGLVVNDQNYSHRIQWSARADFVYEKMQGKPDSSVDGVLFFLNEENQPEWLNLVSTSLNNARDNIERCKIMAAALIKLPAENESELWSTFSRVILSSDGYYSKLADTGFISLNRAPDNSILASNIPKEEILPPSRSVDVPKEEILPPSSAVAPSEQSAQSDNLSPNAVLNEKQDENYEWLLKRELKLFSTLDLAWRKARLANPKQKKTEYASLKKRAHSLGMDLKIYHKKLSLDKLREMVMTVEFVNEYWVKEDIQKIADLPEHALLPGVAESSLLLFMHLKSLKFPLESCRDIAAIYFKGEPAPIPEPDIDPFLASQLSRRQNSIKIGRELLRKRFEQTNLEGSSEPVLSSKQIEFVLNGLTALEKEQQERRSTYFPNSTDHIENDEMSTLNEFLPNLASSVGLPQMSEASLDMMLPQIDDFDGDDKSSRELMRQGEWEQNHWETIMSKRKYVEDPYTRKASLNEPLLNRKLIPTQLDPQVCREIYNSYKENPEYWTPLRLSCLFRVSLLKVEAILILWYMEDCCVARGEFPPFSPRIRVRFDRGPDDRHHDGVKYLIEDYVDKSGFFDRDRPEALFLTQEDLERWMWKKTRPFRDFARLENIYAGNAIPSLGSNRHRPNRADLIITDLSAGRNHPAPQLTVRQKDSTYRWATEKEYMREIDSKKGRPRRKEDGVWEHEYVRRRLVQAGFHYSLLFTENCPVRAAMEGKYPPFNPRDMLRAYERAGDKAPLRRPEHEDPIELEIEHADRQFYFEKPLTQLLNKDADEFDYSKLDRDPETIARDKEREEQEEKEYRELAMQLQDDAHEVLNAPKTML